MLAGGLDNPYIAAALGLGGGLMSSADAGGTLGQGLRTGFGGGVGGLIGAQRLMSQREEEEERRRTMQELIDRLGAVAGRAGGGGILSNPRSKAASQWGGVLSQYGGLVP